MSQKYIGLGRLLCGLLAVTVLGGLSQSPVDTRSVRTQYGAAVGRLSIVHVAIERDGAPIPNAPH